MSSEGEYMAIQVVEFLNGGGCTKLERFLPKNQHTQRKLLNFENWCSGEVSKEPKFDFQSQFSMSKIIRIFLNFFVEEYQFRSTILFMIFFDSVTLLLK